MKLTFYGGAKAVTGSNYLLESGDKKILVDCGLFQSGNFCEKQNFAPFPYKPDEVEAVFVTHAHIDHIGKLPKLVKEGFKGKIFSTPPTRDFAELLLLDSENLMNKEAERERCPALYTAADIEKLMSLWEVIPYHKKVDVGPF